jgi:bifunctional ADP-heptose synthase (sugar kinase/adenylyltransferase)
MIVTAAELADLAGRVVMVDGGFDPLHAGHVAYFQAAAALGLPVLCNISPDEWILRKHPVLLERSQRANVIDEFRSIAYTHLANESTRDVLAAARPKLYAKGADWRDRLPAEELALCAEAGIEIVYLDTAIDSSSRIVERFKQELA